MEKYYIVTDESPLYKEYFDYKAQQKKFNEKWKRFTEQVGITAKEYCQSAKRLLIVPSEEDFQKFAGQLKVDDLGRGLREFKKNSSTYKAWKKFCEDENLMTPHAPWLFDYFNVYGEVRHRLFDIDGILYCYFESKEFNFNDPEGFIEIKASEFYKAIEDYNSRFEKEGAK